MGVALLGRWCGVGAWRAAGAEAVSRARRAGQSARGHGPRRKRFASESNHRHSALWSCTALHRARARAPGFLHATLCLLTAFTIALKKYTIFQIQFYVFYTLCLQYEIDLRVYNFTHTETCVCLYLLTAVYKIKNNYFIFESMS